MSEVNIIAVISPAPGKGDRVSLHQSRCRASFTRLTRSCSQLKELLAGMCKDVHSNEDYTLRYMMTEQLDAENPDIIMIET